MPILFNNHAISSHSALENGEHPLKASEKEPESDGMRRSSRMNDPMRVHPAILVILLGLICILSFGFSYLLIELSALTATRPDPPSDTCFWPNSTVQSSQSLPSINANFSGFRMQHPKARHFDDLSEEKYISYLHHSGFHNQRISLENAFVLAYLLNRTLIIPPIRLGSPALHHRSFDKMQLTLAMDGKDGLRHCQRAEYRTTPECLEFEKWTHLSWSYLMDIQKLGDELGVKVIERFDMTTDWLSRNLNLSASDDIYYLKDNAIHEFAFTDVPIPSNSTYKNFKNVVPMSSLAVPHRLLHLGTLFGTSRLRIITAEGQKALRQVRSGMVFRNSTLHEQATGISSKLGSGYIGLHLRVGDGLFKTLANSHSRQAWWMILRDMMALDDSVVHDLELNSFEKRGLGNNAVVTAPPRRRYNITDLRVRTLPSIMPLPESLLSSCRSPLHTLDFEILNTPIYISTDAQDPISDPIFARFIETFPCVFFMSDFETDLNLNLYNPYDGVNLSPFLRGFVDAIVASMGSRVVGTPGSTYSSFVEDVLWRRYHGWKIISRGGPM